MSPCGMYPRAEVMIRAMSAIGAEIRMRYITHAGEWESWVGDIRWTYNGKTTDWIYVDDSPRQYLSIEEFLWYACNARLEFKIVA